MSEGPIMRICPWKGVPQEWQLKVRRGRNYYLLTIYLREYPPNEERFKISDLAEMYDSSYAAIYMAASQYRMDSLAFMKYVPLPSEIKEPPKAWKWAIDNLHNDGFYLINPSKYHNGWWEEPSFRQFEDYTARYAEEGYQRIVNRMIVARDFGLKIDKIDIRGELGYAGTRKLMLEGKTDVELNPCEGCKHEWRCIPPSGFKCPWGWKYKSSPSM